jgi:hypothetical protein
MCSCCRSFPCQCIYTFYIYTTRARVARHTVKSGWYIQNKAIHVIPLRAMCSCCRSFPCQRISIFLYTRSYITSSVARHTVKSGWYMAIRFVHLRASTRLFSVSLFVHKHTNSTVHLLCTCQCKKYAPYLNKQCTRERQDCTWQRDVTTKKKQASRECVGVCVWCAFTRKCACCGSHELAYVMVWMSLLMYSSRQP